MRAPRWFYLFLALCVLVLTAAAGLRLRWRYLGQGASFDTWYSRVCIAGRGCLVYGDSVHHRPPPAVPARASPRDSEDLIREYLAR